MWTLGIPISKLFLYLPEATLSYLSKLNWSNVKGGFGNKHQKYSVYKGAPTLGMTLQHVDSI